MKTLSKETLCSLSKSLSLKSRIITIILVFLLFPLVLTSSTNIPRTNAVVSTLFIIANTCSMTIPTSQLSIVFDRSDLGIQTITGFTVTIARGSNLVVDSTFVSSDFTASGSTVVVANGFKKMSSTGCLPSGNIIPNYIQLDFTASFQQTGLFTLTLKSDSNLFSGSYQFVIQPETLTACSLNLVTGLSLQAYQTGSYKVSFTAQTPYAYFDSVVLILMDTWDSDEILAGACETASATSASSFAMAGVTSFSMSLQSTLSNVATYSATVTATLLTAAINQITFSMRNPHSLQTIPVSTLIQFQLQLVYQSNIVYQSAVTSLPLTNLASMSYSCQTHTLLSCATTAAPTVFNHANCIVGNTVILRIATQTQIFLEAYSSVDLTISDTAQLTTLPSSSITYSDATNSLSLTGVVLSTVSGTSPYSYLASFNQFNTYDTTNPQYVCPQSGTTYLYLTISAFTLPIDTKGFVIALKFYTQPYTSTKGTRDTTISSRIMNAYCSDGSYYAINANNLASALVTTVDSTQLLVGKTDAQHIFYLETSFYFTTTSAKIEITFPSLVTPASSSTICSVNVINKGTSTSTSAPASCSISGQVVTTTFTSTGSFSMNAMEVIFSTITNPSVITYSGDFTAKLYCKGSSLSAVSAAAAGVFGYTTTPALFDYINISTSNLPVNQASAAYTVQITPPVALSTGQYLDITFPYYVDAVSVVSPATLFATYTSATSGSIITLTFSLTGSWTAKTLQTLSLTFRNPPVNNKDYAFTFTAYSLSGVTKIPFIAQTKQFGSSAGFTTIPFQITSTVNTPNHVNLASAIYTLSFTPSVSLTAASKLFVTFVPTQSYTFMTSSVTCSGSSTSCTINSPATNQLTIDFPTAIAAGVALSVSVDSILNYFSLAPVSLKLSLGYTSTQLGNEETIAIKNLSGNEVTDTVLLIQDKSIGAITQYTLSCSQFLPMDMFILTVPSPIKFDSSSTVSLSGAICSSVGVSADLLTLTVSCAPATSTPTIVITHVTNPDILSPAITTPLVLQTFQTISPNKYLINNYSNLVTPLIYSNICDTSNFCKTCSTSNTSNCLSCFSANSVFYTSGSANVQETILDQSLISKSYATCVQTCPSGSYQVTISSVVTCQVCNSNCKTCSGTSTTCLSCKPISSLYLDTTSSTCVATCPTYYFNDSPNICTLCSTYGHCLTCTANSVCQSCVVGFLLQDTSCVLTCSVGYYLSGTNCLPCPTGCSSCTSSLVCNTCSTGYLLYLTVCVTSCPAGSQKLIVSSIEQCSFCDPSCLTCLNYPQTCVSCQSSTYLYGSSCLSASLIPAGYYADRLTWTALPCSTNCITCSTGILCTACSASSYIYKGECFTECPSSTTADTNRNCVADSSSSSGSSSSSKVVPFPTLLACFIFCISVYFSKSERIQTFVPGCIVGFCSFFEWCSWVILIVIEYFYDKLITETTLLAIFGFVLLYILNIYSFILFKRSTSSDTEFKEWSSKPGNSKCKKIVLMLSLLFSFKIQKILFCKYFNQEVFKAKLVSIDSFSTLNRVSLLSGIVNSLAFIASAAVFGYRLQHNTMVFILSLDTLSVTVFLLIFMIWEALKKSNFFEEPTAVDTEVKFIQKFIPFDQSYLDKRTKSSIYSHLKKIDSNSNLMEFTEDFKRPYEEKLQNPITQELGMKDMCKNAPLDKHLLMNALNGAPFVIKDELSENFKPGKPRQFGKKHISPVFNPKDFPSIKENDLSEEGENPNMDDYYNESHIVPMGSKGIMSYKKGFDESQLENNKNTSEKQSKRHKFKQNKKLKENKVAAEGGIGEGKSSRKYKLDKEATKEDIGNNNNNTLLLGNNDQQMSRYFDRSGTMNDDHNLSIPTGSAIGNQLFLNDQSLSLQTQPLHSEQNNFPIRENKARKNLDYSDEIVVHYDEIDQGKPDQLKRETINNNNKYLSPPSRSASNEHVSDEIYHDQSDSPEGMKELKVSSRSDAGNMQPKNQPPKKGLSFIVSNNQGAFLEGGISKEKSKDLIEQVSQKKANTDTTPTAGFKVEMSQSSAGISQLTQNGISHDRNIGNNYNQNNQPYDINPKFYDNSRDSLQSASNCDNYVNEISPSDFNMMNQRYDENLFNTSGNSNQLQPINPQIVTPFSQNTQLTAGNINLEKMFKHLERMSMSSSSNQPISGQIKSDLKNTNPLSFYDNSPKIIYSPKKRTESRHQQPSNALHVVDIKKPTSTLESMKNQLVLDNISQDLDDYDHYVLPPQENQPSWTNKYEDQGNILFSSQDQRKSQSRPRQERKRTGSRGRTPGGMRVTKAKSSLSTSNNNTASSLVSGIYFGGNPTIQGFDAEDMNEQDDGAGEQETVSFPRFNFPQQ